MSYPVMVNNAWRSKFGMNAPTFTPQQAAEFASWVISFQDRPWDWVQQCYPWLEPNSPLADKIPQLWQRTWLKRLQAELQRNDLSVEEIANRVIRMSTAAGNGVGKTALVAQVIHWFCSVFPKGEAVITASTAAQLETKTWRELRKWQELAINGWQFEWSATRYRHRDAPEQWYAAATPWSESNPQAFAGTHEKYVLIVFDEASGIHHSIWDVIEGAMTTGLVFFLAFGNPSETEGGFYDTHNKMAAMWIRFRVDAREVTFANQKEIAKWIEVYGRDSDFCKVHIYGQFPAISSTTFISDSVVQQAIANNINWRTIPRAVPRLMGVDFARQGVDLNVIVKRQGRKVHDNIKQWAERDTMVSADYIAREINEWQPDLVFCDGAGLGGPIIDYLKRRGFDRVIVEVQGGAKPNDPRDAQIYANMRTCMWARGREWLPYADLPADRELAEEICSPKFRHELKTDRTLLEPKAEMAKRGVRSPNKADALFNTFWYVTPAAGGSGGGYAEPDAV